MVPVRYPTQTSSILSIKLKVLSRGKRGRRRQAGSASAEILPASKAKPEQPVSRILGLEGWDTIRDGRRLWLTSLG